MKRWWVWLLIIFVLVQVARQVHDILYDRRLESEAKEWVNRAKNAATGAFTINDAEHWLRENGFRPVLVGSGHHSGPNIEEDYSVVGGWLQLSSGGFGLKPAWLELEFRFTPDVESRIDRHFTPARMSSIADQP
jgi:hypothetical protein